MTGGTEGETYRSTMQARTPDGKITTVIVTRRNSRVWLTLIGSLRASVVMTNGQSGSLITLLHEAKQPR